MLSGFTMSVAMILKKKLASPKLARAMPVKLPVLVGK